MKSSPPLPPPCREYRGGHTLVNEYKTVDWCTQMGILFDEKMLTTNIPKLWLFRLFMSKDQIRLEQSLRMNREICREWQLPNNLTIEQMREYILRIARLSK